MNVSGASPQSTILAQSSNEFRPEYTFHECGPRTLLEPSRIPWGPNRAPGLKEVPVSKGAPRTAMSYFVVSSSSAALAALKQGT